MRVLASIGLTAALVVGAAAPSHLPAGAAPAAEPAAPGAGTALGTGDGYVPAAAWRQRQDDYLGFATEVTDLGSLSNVTAHLARSERDAGYTFDGTALQPSHLAGVFAKIDAHEDTSDFDMMRLALLWWAYRDRLDPATVAAVEQRFTGFRYWYTDPLPEGVIDDKWFWSENHRLIVHTLEYLSGRALPDATFAFTGETGAVHAARGRERIEEWLDEKIAFGFSEWHSDVYYAKDIEPLLLLTEFAEDDIAQRAAGMLDMFLYDLAVHQRAGNVGVTHGRSYMKDMSKATDQDVFNVVKLAFDTTSQPYTSRGDATVMGLARADRYRLPEALVRVARSTRTFVDRQTMGAPLDVDEPFTTTPVPAAGAAPYDTADGVPFWWERGALTAWQVVPRTLATIEEHDLFDTSLFQPYKALVDLTGGDPAVARQLAYALRCQINVGLLAEVDTITWRSADAMLSNAQDYRPGCHGNQYHAWQATLDEDAVVFTTNPGNEPRPGNRWVDADLYWSGGSTMPRSAQHGSALIAMYAPQYAPSGPPLDAFSYLPYTHAYFPTERFDEVRQVGSWTFGRKGDGYVGLYSWRPTQWREHDPAQTFTNGLTETFDLVAPGGADNVWITEVGDAGRWGSFDGFVTAVAGAAVSVTDRGDTPEGLPKGFDVSYASPANGTMTYGWTGPLAVDGTEVDLHGDTRIDNPFSTVQQGSPQVRVAEAGATLTLDLATGARAATVGSADASFVRAAFADLLGRPATEDEVTREVAVLAAGGSRGTLLRTLTTSDEWLGRIVTDAYANALGRTPDSGGRTYWIDQLRSGRRTPIQVFASLYASPESLTRSGGTLSGWVGSVYLDVLGRSPGTQEAGYWTVQAQAKGRTWVAAAILSTSESRHARVRALYALLLGRAPDAAGLTYWSDRVGREGDIALARSLAASPEYRTRAVSRFP